LAFLKAELIIFFTFEILPIAGFTFQ